MQFSPFIYPILMSSLYHTASTISKSTIILTPMASPTHAFSGKKWIIHGLLWGLFMFIVMVFVFPYFEGEAITQRSILIGVPVWSLAGLGYGYTMKLFSEWQARKASRRSTEN